MYADILASEHGSDWGYTEVNLIGGEQQIADLSQLVQFDALGLHYEAALSDDKTMTFVK